MNLSELTKNSTNRELYEAFGETINDGKTRIFAKHVSSNPDYTTVYLCQSVKTSRSVDSANEFFLGWSSTRLIRAIHNAKTEIADKLPVGSVVPFDILLTEFAGIKAYDTQEPKINPSTGEVIMFNELPVYEHSCLVEKGKGGIVTLQKEEVANVIKVTETPVTKQETVQSDMF
jgi:hypothetical protein